MADKNKSFNKVSSINVPLNEEQNMKVEMYKAQNRLSSKREAVQHLIDHCLELPELKVKVKKPKKK